MISLVLLAFMYHVTLVDWNWSLLKADVKTRTVVVQALLKHGVRIEPTNLQRRILTDPARVTFEESNQNARYRNNKRNRQCTPSTRDYASQALDVSGNVADNWKQFKQVWKNYSIITNLSAQSDEYRVALFLHCIGPEALKIYNGMQFANDEERGSLATILEKFDEFTIREVNETYERYIFNGRNQDPDEPIDAYVAALRSLAKTCGFCECLNDSLLKDRIVLGVNNLNLRKRLLQ